MNWAIFILSSGLIPAAAAIAQELPPGVLLLSKVKRHIKDELRQLPNISCLETVQREHRPRKGKLRPLDTIRLEVLTNGDKELFSSPGDRKFSAQHPISYAGSGVLADGFFGLYLKLILSSGYVSHQYKGEEDIAGRRLAHWGYTLPPMWSGQTVQMLEGSGTVGLHGSYWADPETYDVIRLELNADNVPPALPINVMAASINYARTHVSDRLAVLLPESAEFLMVKNSGEISHNLLEFTHCRSFGVDSSINFGAPEQTPRFAVASVDDTLRPLPAGVEIAVQLRTRISSGTAVGALIDGVVAANVSAKGAVVIAAGSPVRGRIPRLESYRDPIPHFVVALEFTEVSVEGVRYRFYADAIDIEHAPGVEQVLSAPARTEIADVPGISYGRQMKTTSSTLRFSPLPGVATFFWNGDRLNLKQGFRTVWKTRQLAP